MSWALAALLLVVSSASAQEPSPEDVATARQAFAIGVQAAYEERWDDALSAFERAYELVSSPQILLNLAGAQIQTGRLNAGIASYRRFLREAPAALLAQHGAEARRALAQAQRRLARVRVEIRRLAPDDVVMLDGRALRRSRLDALAVDPGPHVVAVLRGERRVGRTSFRVEPGDEIVVRLSVPRDARDGTRGSAGARDTVWSSPWLWLAIGAVAIGAGAGVVAVASSSDEATLYRGTLGDGHAVVR